MIARLSNHPQHPQHQHTTTLTVPMICLVCQSPRSVWCVKKSPITSSSASRFRILGIKKSKLGFRFPAVILQRHGCHGYDYVLCELKTQYYIPQILFFIYVNFPPCFCSQKQGIHCETDRFRPMNKYDTIK